MKTINREATGRPASGRSSDDDVLLPGPAVAGRYGVSDRTIDRWIRDPALEFPQPVMINRRRYFREIELREFERSRVRERGPTEAEGA